MRAAARAAVPRRRGCSSPAPPSRSPRSARSTAWRSARASAGRSPRRCSRPSSACSTGKTAGQVGLARLRRHEHAARGGRGLTRPLQAPDDDATADAVRENLGAPRRRPETRRHAGGAVRRPAPDARGHLAAGVHDAARARARRAPPGAHARDHGSLDADAHRAGVRRRADHGRLGRAADRASWRSNCAEFGVELLGLRHAAARHRARRSGRSWA